MADEAKAPAVADAVKPTDDATPPLDTPMESAVTEEKQTNGGDAAASDEDNKGGFAGRCIHGPMTDSVQSRCRTLLYQGGRLT